MTDSEIIMQHLEEHGSITSFEAIKEYNITRLAAVVHTLRHKRGMDIESIPVGFRKRGHYGEFVRYVYHG